jgi:hypothetical protein
MDIIHIMYHLNNSKWTKNEIVSDLTFDLERWVWEDGSKLLEFTTQLGLKMLNSGMKLNRNTTKKSGPNGP